MEYHRTSVQATPATRVSKRKGCMAAVRAEQLRACSLGITCWVIPYGSFRKGLSQ